MLDQKKMQNSEICLLASALTFYLTEHQGMLTMKILEMKTIRWEVGKKSK